MEKCLACNKKTKLFFKKENTLVYRCPGCGLGNTKNITSQVEDYHRDEDYIKNQKQFENIYKKRVDIINKLSGKQGKVLEIGSSTGLMLALFKREGWEVLGIEISKKSAEFSRVKGIPTLITSFELAKLPKNSFNTVVLNHTLEHLKDPEQVLKKVKTLLASNGLVFIDVPNFGGLSAKIFGSHWPHLLPEEHFWHFSYSSLEKILSKNGFNIIYSARSSGIWDYQNPILELWQSLFTFKKRFFIDFLTALPTFIISKLNIGSGLIIVARKK